MARRTRCGECSDPTSHPVRVGGWVVCPDCWEGLTMSPQDPDDGPTVAPVNDPVAWGVPRVEVDR